MCLEKQKHFQKTQNNNVLAFWKERTFLDTHKINSAYVFRVTFSQGQKQTVYVSDDKFSRNTKQTKQVWRISVIQIKPSSTFQK